MDAHEKQYRIFQVVKYWADNALAGQKCYLDDEAFFRRCNHPDLSDARCLYRMIIKEVEAHNAKIQSKRTLLNNMKYKPKYLASNVFSGLKVPISEIERYIVANPEKSSYDCYRFVTFGQIN